MFCHMANLLATPLSHYLYGQHPRALKSCTRFQKSISKFEILMQKFEIRNFASWNSLAHALVLMHKICIDKTQSGLIQVSGLCGCFAICWWFVCTRPHSHLPHYMIIEDHTVHIETIQCVFIFIFILFIELYDAKLYIN